MPTLTQSCCCLCLCCPTYQLCLKNPHLHWSRPTNGMGQFPGNFLFHLQNCNRYDIRHRSIHTLMDLRSNIWYLQHTTLHHGLHRLSSVYWRLHGKLNFSHLKWPHPTTQELGTRLWAIKETYPPLLRKIKDLVNLKKALAGDGDWNTAKEIIRWVVNTDKGTLHLTATCITDLVSLWTLPPTQRRLSEKRLERLLVKLRSIHLAIPGEIRHFYHIYMVLIKENRNTAYLSDDFHQEVANWHMLLHQIHWYPTYLTDIVQCLPTNLIYTDESGLGTWGVWLDPNANASIFVLRLPWPTYIMAVLN